MVYKIDQSGKVEDTSKNTVLACCNGEEYCVLITRRTKRRIQEIFRTAGMRELFVYWTFAAGLYVLLENFKRDIKVVVDMEYLGRDKMILSMVNEITQIKRSVFHDIRFSRIGSKPKVHYLAKRVFDGKKKADRIIAVDEIIELIKRTKTGGRLSGCIPTRCGARPRSSYRKLIKK